MYIYIAHPCIYKYIHAGTARWRKSRCNALCIQRLYTQTSHGLWPEVWTSTSTCTTTIPCKKLVCLGCMCMWIYIIGGEVLCVYCGWLWGDIVMMSVITLLCMYWISTSTYTSTIPFRKLVCVGWCESVYIIRWDCVSVVGGYGYDECYSVLCVVWISFLACMTTMSRRKSVCVCVCAMLCMCMCMFIYIHVFVGVYMCMHVYVLITIYVCIYVCTTLTRPIKYVHDFNSTYQIWTRPLSDLWNLCMTLTRPIKSVHVPHPSYQMSPNCQ